MSHIQIVHVAPMNESGHIYECRAVQATQTGTLAVGFFRRGTFYRMISYMYCSVLQIYRRVLQCVAGCPILPHVLLQDFIYRFSHPYLAHTLRKALSTARTSQIDYFVTSVTCTTNSICCVKDPWPTLIHRIESESDMEVTNTRVCCVCVVECTHKHKNF